MLLLISYTTGLLTAFSPCILPIIPMIIGSTSKKNIFAPLLISLGLVISYAIFSVFISFSQQFINLDYFNYIGAVIFITIGLMMTVKSFNAWAVQRFLAPLSAKFSNNRFTQSADSISFLLMGLTLGIVWAPCIASTFGLIVGAAIQNNEPIFTFLLFLMYSIGIVTPILLISYGLKSIIIKNRNRFIRLSIQSQLLFGYSSIIAGIIFLFKLDQLISIYFHKIFY